MSQVFAMHHAGNSLAGTPHAGEARARSLAAAGLLPLHARWGDGTELSRSEVAALAALHSSTTVDEVELELEAGDLVVVNNFRWCHGRTPYEGDERDVLVAMSEPVARRTRFVPEVLRGTAKNYT